MKTGFIQNSNYTRFLQAVKAVESRGDKQSGLLLISGDPGVGKSTVIERWSSDNDALYLRAISNMKHKYILEQFIELAKVDLSAVLDEKGRVKERASRTINDMQKKLTSHIARKQSPIVIDEVQHLLVNDALVLEVIRDISDLTGVTVIFVAGVANFGYQLKAYPQISSRIYQEVAFSPWDVKDISMACKQMSEVPIEDALVQRLKDDSKGVMRLVMNGISNIERVAKANHQAVATSDFFKGKELVNDWDGNANASVRARRRA